MQDFAEKNHFLPFCIHRTVHFSRVTARALSPTTAKGSPETAFNLPSLSYGNWELFLGVPLEKIGKRTQYSNQFWVIFSHQDT